MLLLVYLNLGMLILFTFAVVCINDLQCVYDIVSVCLLITIMSSIVYFERNAELNEDEITGLIKTNGFLVNFLSEFHVLVILVL